MRGMYQDEGKNSYNVGVLAIDDHVDGAPSNGIAILITRRGTSKIDFDLVAS